MLIGFSVLGICVTHMIRPPVLHGIVWDSPSTLRDEKDWLP